MKLGYKKSQRTIEIESYVTLRNDWPQELALQVSLEYNARGFRVIDGKTEWQYFHTAAEAKGWADSIHTKHLTANKKPLY